jgi:hypothetical protein
MCCSYLRTTIISADTFKLVSGTDLPKPWVASVRRNCLDNILKWPGESAHQTSYASEKVAGNVAELLEKAKKRSPYATWLDFENQLKEYGHDLFSIRDAVQPKANAAKEAAREGHQNATLATSQPENTTNSANTAKLFRGSVPENPDIVDLVARLDAAKGSGKSDNDVARELTGETYPDDPRAQSLLSQVRRLKRKGRITL